MWLHFLVDKTKYLNMQHALQVQELHDLCAVNFKCYRTLNSWSAGVLLCIKKCTVCPFELAFPDTTQLLKSWPTKSQWEFFHWLSKGKIFLSVGIFLLKEFCIHHPSSHLHSAVCWQLFFDSFYAFRVLRLKTTNLHVSFLVTNVLSG